VPRLEADAIAPIVDFMGKKSIAVESVVDNSIVDRLMREGFVDKLFKKRLSLESLRCRSSLN